MMSFEKMRTLLRVTEKKKEKNATRSCEFSQLSINREINDDRDDI